jgi:hypothetical protein
MVVLRGQASINLANFFASCRLGIVALSCVSASSYVLCLRVTKYTHPTTTTTANRQSVSPQKLSEEHCRLYP